jgi:NIMA (never in mitosis gene a)-related kinase 2
MTQETPTHLRRTSASQPMTRPISSTKIPSLETPVNRPAYTDFIPSAMKGIVLTSTGESLATPSQAELVNLFNCSPKVGLNFAKIFDFEAGDHNGIPAGKRRDDEEAADSPPPSPSSRKTKEMERRKEIDESPESSSSTSNSCALSTATTSQVSAAAPPTRIRRPSIRNSTRPTHSRAGTLPTSVSDPTFPTTTSSSSAQPKPLPHPHLRPSKSNSNLASNPATMIRATTMPALPQVHHRAPPEYDFTDEENLPSPFLKKSDKHSQAKAAGVVGPMTNLTAIAPGPSTAPSTSSTSRGKRRPSSGLLLRAVAAANNVERRGTFSSTSTVSPLLDNGNPQLESMPTVDTGITMDNHNGGGIPRPSLASARKASEEARKALLRT